MQSTFESFIPVQWKVPNQNLYHSSWSRRSNSFPKFFFRVVQHLSPCVNSCKHCISILPVMKRFRGPSSSHNCLSYSNIKMTCDTEDLKEEGREGEGVTLGFTTWHVCKSSLCDRDTGKNGESSSALHTCPNCIIMGQTCSQNAGSAHIG